MPLGGRFCGWIVGIVRQYGQYEQYFGRSAVISASNIK